MRDIDSSGEARSTRCQIARSRARRRAIQIGGRTVGVVGRNSCRDPLVALARDYGIHDATMDPTREDVYGFLHQFFGEMVRLFPDPFVHIGGDEVSGRTEWNSNPRIQQFIREANKVQADEKDAFDPWEH